MLALVVRFFPLVFYVKLLALIMNALLSRLSNNKLQHAGFEMLAAGTVSFLVGIFLMLLRTSTSLGPKNNYLVRV